MQTEQVLCQAEIHPAARAGRRVEAVSHFSGFHQALAGAARGTNCHHGLALPSGESQHFLKRAVTEGGEMQVGIQGGVGEGLTPGGGVETDK
jgi:hypothetical protein